MIYFANYGEKMKKMCIIMLALIFVVLLCACIDDTEKEDISDYFEDKNEDVVDYENEITGSLIHHLKYSKGEISKIY